MALLSVEQLGPKSLALVGRRQGDAVDGLNGSAAETVDQQGLICRCQLGSKPGFLALA